MTTRYSTRRGKIRRTVAVRKTLSLFALTVDTHHPDGFISRTCERKRYDVDGKKNLSFSAVSCSRGTYRRANREDQSLSLFQNTVIVVSSDHRP